MNTQATTRLCKCQLNADPCGLHINCHSCRARRQPLRPRQLDTTCAMLPSPFISPFSSASKITFKLTYSLSSGEYHGERHVTLTKRHFQDQMPLLTSSTSAFFVYKCLRSLLFTCHSLSSLPLSCVSFLISPLPSSPTMSLSIPPYALFLLVQVVALSLADETTNATSAAPTQLANASLAQIETTSTATPVFHEATDQVLSSKKEASPTSPAHFVKNDFTSSSLSPSSDDQASSPLSDPLSSGFDAKKDEILSTAAKDSSTSNSNSSSTKSYNWLFFHHFASNAGIDSVKDQIDAEDSFADNMIQSTDGSIMTVDDNPIPPPQDPGKKSDGIFSASSDTLAQFASVLRNTTFDGHNSTSSVKDGPVSSEESRAVKDATMNSTGTSAKAKTKKSSASLPLSSIFSFVTLALVFCY